MFKSFVKKELIESIRTYKLFILLITFCLFGFANPIVAKVMPDILSSVMPDNINIELATPTALDAWAQFFKNISQMGLLIIAIIFSGLIANELSKETLINVLTKGLSRATVIWSKFVVASLLWTISYGLCFSLTLFYVAYLWPNSIVPNLLLSVVGLWLFAILMIGSLILGGVIFKSNLGALLSTLVTIIIMAMLNIVPVIQKFNPITLATQNMSLLTNQLVASNFYPALIVTAIIIIIFMTLSVIIFNKKQI